MLTHISNFYNFQLKLLKLKRIKMIGLDSAVPSMEKFWNLRFMWSPLIIMPEDPLVFAKTDNIRACVNLLKAVHFRDVGSIIF